jgi:hypothetical protein
MNICNQTTDKKICVVCRPEPCPPKRAKICNVFPNQFPETSITPLTDNEVRQMFLIPKPSRLVRQTNNPYLPRSVIEANDENEEISDSGGRGGVVPPPPLPPPPPSVPPLTVIQYTPEYTLNAGNTFPNSYPSGASIIRGECSMGVRPHDPRGSPTTRLTNWQSANWDGVPFDYLGKTKEQIHEFLRPGYPANKYAIRGLEQRFYQLNPFADNSNPTVGEIDTWNIEVIRHLRAVLGVKVTTPGPLLGQTIPILPDPRLYIEAAWADERRWSQVWDTKYPNGVIVNGVEYFGFAPGPCWLPNTNPPQVPLPYNAHCGGKFAPNTTDAHAYRLAAPYHYNTAVYPELASHGNLVSFTEGISGIGTEVPWSLRLALIITNFIKDEGYSGHAGPFFTRPYVGMSWRCDAQNKAIGFRGKWNGRIRLDSGTLDRPYGGPTVIPP